MRPCMLTMRPSRALWLAAALLSGAAWASAGTHSLHYRPGTDWGSVSVRGGSLSIMFLDHSINPVPRSMQSSAEFGVLLHSRERETSCFKWPIFGSILHGVYVVSVPLWIPTLLLLIISARPWEVVVESARSLRRVRRRTMGYCEQCGYDAGALPDAAHCPECGQHTAASVLLSVSDGVRA